MYHSSFMISKIANIGWFYRYWKVLLLHYYTSIHLQIYTLYKGNLSEWLRRKIRNLLGFARAGSNPAVVVIFLVATSFQFDRLIG